MTPFADRADAGRTLARLLTRYAGDPDVLVLALPRGGVRVGVEVACALRLPLDVLVIRKLGVPGQPELAMGAIAPGNVRVENPEVLDALGIPPALLDEVEAAERAELERRNRAYRGGSGLPVVRGRTVILVDDGIATGSTVRAAIRLLRQLRPNRLVVAVPVAAPEALHALAREADEVVAVAAPTPFTAISLWYDDFPQLTDAEVRACLEAVPHRPPPGEADDRPVG